MGIDDWQRQLLVALTRLEAGVNGLRTQVDGLTTDVDGLRTETRGDFQRLTRIIARRFGSSGSTHPMVGDHVLYHLRADRVCLALVMNASGDDVDLEVMGDEVSLRERFPRNVPAGTAPGCWSFPA